MKGFIFFMASGESVCVYGITAHIFACEAHRSIDAIYGGIYDGKEDAYVELREHQQRLLHTWSVGAQQKFLIS